MVSFSDQFPEFNGRKIEIRKKDGYFSATDMSQVLDKTFSDWKRTKFAERLLNRLSDRLNLPIDRESDYANSRSRSQVPLVDYVRGDGQKMWIHPALAMSYAMSNPELQADINVWIYELLTLGTVNAHVLKWTREELERGIEMNRDDIKEMYS